MQVLADQAPHQKLRADELVTTGTVTSAYTVKPVQHWQTAIGGVALPGLSVIFTD